MNGRIKTSFSDGERHLPCPDSISASDYLAVIERLDDHHRQWLQWHRGNIPKIEELLNRLRKEIVSKVGEGQWKKLRDYKKDRRRSNHGLNTFNIGRDDQIRLADARRESREKALSFLKGVDIPALNRMRQDYHKQIDSIIHPKRAETIKMEILAEDEAPDRILTAKGGHNQRITMKPPYDSGWWRGHFDRIGGSDPTADHYVDASIGRVGHSSQFMDFDTGEADYYHLREWSDLHFYKDIPMSGKWDVTIEAECVTAQRYVYLDNEFGDSEVYVSLDADCIFYADGFPVGPQSPLNPNPGAIGGSFWEWSVQEVPSDSYRYGPKEIYEPGYVKTFILHTPFEVPAQNGCLISVGSFEEVHANLDDTGALIRMDNKWKIKKVTIDIKA